MLKKAPKRGLAIFLLVPVLAACTEPSLLPAAEAAGRYQELSIKVSEALTGAFAGQGWSPVDGRAMGIAKDNDGKCIPTVETLRSPDAVNQLAGGWDPVMAAIAPVLESAGMDPITTEDSIKGGWTGISSQDNHGGRLRIHAKSFTELTISAQIQDKECP